MNNRMSVIGFVMSVIFLIACLLGLYVLNTYDLSEVYKDDSFDIHRIKLKNPEEKKNGFFSTVGDAIKKSDDSSLQSRDVADDGNSQPTKSFSESIADFWGGVKDGTVNAFGSDDKSDESRSDTSGKQMGQVSAEEVDRLLERAQRLLEEARLDKEEARRLLEEARNEKESAAEKTSDADSMSKAAEEAAEDAKVIYASAVQLREEAENDKAEAEKARQEADAQKAEAQRLLEEARQTADAGVVEKSVDDADDSRKKEELQRMLSEAELALQNAKEEEERARKLAEDAYARKYSELPEIYSAEASWETAIIANMNDSKDDEFTYSSEDYDSVLFSTLGKPVIISARSIMAEKTAFEKILEKKYNEGSVESIEEPVVVEKNVSVIVNKPLVDPPEIETAHLDVNVKRSTLVTEAVIPDEIYREPYVEPEDLFFDEVERVMPVEGVVGEVKIDVVRTVETIEDDGARPFEPVLSTYDVRDSYDDSMESEYKNRRSSSKKDAMYKVFPYVFSVDAEGYDYETGTYLKK